MTEQLSLIAEHVGFQFYFVINNVVVSIPVCTY